MAKKTFSFDKPSQGENIQKPSSQSLSLLAKPQDETADIFEINLNFNRQIVKLFEELFGPKWKYRTIKEVAELTGVTLKHGQLKLFSQGKSFHQQNMFALLFVIAHHKKEMNITIKDKQIIIK